LRRGVAAGHTSRRMPCPTLAAVRVSPPMCPVGDLCPMADPDPTADLTSALRLTVRQDITHSQTTLP
jgi:hypothetical protein